VDEKSSVVANDAGTGEAPVPGPRHNGDGTACDRICATLQQSQRMETLGLLAGGIVHDFNNVLTAILGHLDLADRIAAGDVQHHLSAAGKAARRAAELSRHLLALSRPEPQERRAVDPRALVQDVTGMLRETIDRRIQIVTTAPAGLWPVHADPGRIGQVLMNLCINARDAILEILEGREVACSTGSAETFEIRIDLRNVEVDAALAGRWEGARPGPYVEIAVADNGVGMDAKTLARIFDPFFTTKTPGRGTGLGLATVRAILAAHDGFLTVCSVPYEGSVFRVHLPRSDQPVAEPPPAPDVARDVPGGTETILLVDDEEFLRQLGETVLTRKGYTVVTAADGREALDIFVREAARFDLVLLDVIMPRLSGKEVLCQIRRIAPESKVVLTSGMAGAKQVRELEGLGAAHVLTKPYPIDELPRVVRAVLDAPGSETRVPNASAPVAGAIEHRRHPRRPVRLTVAYNHRDEGCTDVATDLGAGGLFLATDREMRPGERLWMAFQIGGPEDEMVRVPGEVVWRGSPGGDSLTRKGAGVGVRFLDPHLRGPWLLPL
jgi:nitrogen-specific signal transduction histidine kinase/DNA-binding NarL/FixJ family response regulator